MHADRRAEELLRSERERNSQLEYQARRKRQLVALPVFAAMMIGSTYAMASLGMTLLACLNALLVVYIFLRVAAMFRMDPDTYMAVTKPRVAGPWYWLAGLVLIIIGSIVVGWWYDT